MMMWSIIGVMAAALFAYIVEASMARLNALRGNDAREIEIGIESELSKLERVSESELNRPERVRNLVAFGASFVDGFVSGVRLIGESVTRTLGALLGYADRVDGAASSMARPPAQRLLAVITWLVSERTREGLVDEAVEDMYDAYFEALEAVELCRARWIIVRDMFVLLKNLGLWRWLKWIGSLGVVAKVGDLIFKLLK